VMHLAGLRAAGRGSLSERLDAIVDRFPQAATLLSFYSTLAGRAAGRLGIEVAGRPKSLARERLFEAGLIPVRNQLADLLNRRGLCGTGVEVGVRIGIFSETILQRWRGRTLISVDPWLEAEPDEVQDRTQAEHEQFYEETVARLGKYGERSVIWRATSTEAAARVEAGSLDFVYLDARHDYESVKEDLEHWFDKVRPGGILAGHDYVDGTWGELSFGVKSAVDEFFGARGLPVKTTYAQTRPASWLVEVPTPG
jgi:Methyltransferase domain